MRDSIELEMLTRSVETGPKPETFSIRDGALSYAPFDLDADARRRRSTTSTARSRRRSTSSTRPSVPRCARTTTRCSRRPQIPGTEGILPYGSCLRLDVAGEILGEIFKIDFGVDETHPVCETTRTTISALRIGDYVSARCPASSP